MTKLVIIEGTDLSGKTTFIERLAKRLNNGFIIKNTYKPRSIEEKDKIKDQYNYLLSLIRRAAKTDEEDRFIIMDRFYQSQMCYSYKRGEDDFGDRFYTRFENRLIRVENLEVYYIWINVDVETLETRFMNRGEDYIDMQDLKILNDRYKKYFDRSVLKKIDVVNQDGNIDSKIEDLVKWLM